MNIPAFAGMTGGGANSVTADGGTMGERMAGERDAENGRVVRFLHHTLSPLA